LSSSTERVIRIKAEDDASSNLLTIARSFRGLATVIRQTILFTRQLIAIQEIEQLSALKTAAVYRILAVAKLAAIGLGVGGAIIALAATAAMMQSGAGPIPVAFGQTAQGTSRNVSASGLAVIHAGETISRGTPSAGGGKGGDINITIHSAQMSYRAGIEETARDLGTLIYQGYRRLRH
jgi:hypothetical protein